MSEGIGNWYVCFLNKMSVPITTDVVISNLDQGCTTLCDKICQWLPSGRLFSPGPPVSSTNKTDRHCITEILLKVVFNTIKERSKEVNRFAGKRRTRFKIAYILQSMTCFIIYLHIEKKRQKINKGTIQRNWQHRVHKTKKTLSKQNMYWTPLYANKRK